MYIFGRHISKRQFNKHCGIRHDRLTKIYNILNGRAQFVIQLVIHCHLFCCCCTLLFVFATYLFFLSIANWLQMAMACFYAFIFVLDILLPSEYWWDRDVTLVALDKRYWSYQYRLSDALCTKKCFHLVRVFIVDLVLKQVWIKCVCVVWWSRAGSGCQNNQTAVITLYV